MGDYESRQEDYRQEKWERDHEGEYGEECPDCGENSLRLVEKIHASYIDPGCEVWSCPCGFEGEFLTR